MLSTKTQFAGYKNHILVVELMKHLSKKYLSEFKMTDEGEYWETENEELLKENFKRYEGLMNLVTGALESSSRKTGESAMAYLEKVLSNLSAKMGI